MALDQRNNRISTFLDTPPAVPSKRRRNTSAKIPAGDGVAPLRSPAQADADEYPRHLYAVPFVDAPVSQDSVDRADDFLRCAQRLLATLRAGEQPDWPAHDAPRLAQLVVRHVIAIGVDVVPTDDDIPPGAQDAFDKEEWRLRRAYWAVLRPAQKSLTDPVYVTAVLMGRTMARPVETKALLAVLDEFVRRTRIWFRNYREYEDQTKTCRKRNEQGRDGLAVTVWFPPLSCDG